ncbi:fatty acid desaturase [Kaistia hirudinis]|uniref:Fatty acid desaturase n=1 Tax=Kaistia hirudinis TaxID=1293440 RepID=A0A840AP52_9HYPH|nr:fatty acid desaturase family protein [Kaistia hirudinis]MBB3930295.1 fatty acid desaturase [Kaistia hirudinis]
MADPTRRDYSLIGLDSRLAVERGLATAEWYKCPVDRKTMKELMKRSDGPAIRDTLLWFAFLAASGFGGWWFWGTWWAVPFFIVYGVLYGSASDSRWHECGHGTAFKTRWMNDVVYHIACFMILREPTVWRWSHTRHHTDTIIVGRDPEIGVQRPPNIFGILIQLFAIKSTWATFKKLCIHATGRLTAEEKTFIPESEQHKVYGVARIYLAIFAAVAVWCFAIGSILPAMFIGLPTFYGCFMGVFFGLTQHAGLDEDVLDHRLNSRTVYMNPVFRFLYLNMNYHVEHHMFPMVPYHALPRLHEVIKADCPKPYSSCWDAYKEIIPALLRQRREPGWYVKRPLPGHVEPLGAPPPGLVAAE